MPTQIYPFSPDEEHDPSSTITDTLPPVATTSSSEPRVEVSVMEASTTAAMASPATSIAAPVTPTSAAPSGTAGFLSTGPRLR